jgi:hypothetical protein
MEVVVDRGEADQLPALVAQGVQLGHRGRRALRADQLAVFPAGRDVDIEGVGAELRGPRPGVAGRERDRADIGASRAGLLKDQRNGLRSG